MGEEAFREGIHDYLVSYGYGNATWDDLIQILDSKVALGGEGQYVLPNSDGRGYGYFRYDTASLEWILENWGAINKTQPQ